MSAFPRFTDANAEPHRHSHGRQHLDRAAYNVLVSKFAAGLFENPYTDESRVGHLDSPDNRKIARDHAEQGPCTDMDESPCGVSMSHG